MCLLLKDLFSAFFENVLTFCIISYMIDDVNPKPLIRLLQSCRARSQAKSK